MDALVLCVPPPPILGLGTTGGFKLFVQDKGNVGTEQLFAAAQTALGAARQHEALDMGLRPYLGDFRCATHGGRY